MVWLEDIHLLLIGENFIKEIYKEITEMPKTLRKILKLQFSPMRKIIPLGASIKFDRLQGGSKSLKVLCAFIPTKIRITDFVTIQ